jgi:membrane-associated phospholipid phosphatase
MPVTLTRAVLLLVLASRVASAQPTREPDAVDNRPAALPPQKDLEALEDSDAPQLEAPQWVTSPPSSASAPNVPAHSLAPAPNPDSEPGFLVGDRFRYPRFGLIPGLLARTAMDLIAIPAGLPQWDWKDWLAAGVAVGSTVALSLPLGPSLDVRLQQAIRGVVFPGVSDRTRALIWTPAGDVLIWVSIWSATAGTLLAGVLGDNPAYTETAALMVEAFAVTQIYNNLIKLLTGREGPKDGDGQGRYFGPSGFVRLFPSGTPSGHVATMMAMASVVMHYWNSPAVWISLSAFAALFCATIVVDNYHFVSEVVLGAALGFAVGRWVVHHRSSRFRNSESGLPFRLPMPSALSPMLLPNGGLGLAASWAL